MVRRQYKDQGKALDKQRFLTGRYEMKRSRAWLEASTAVIAGIGILVLAVGATTGLYSLGLGVVGAVGVWTVGITLRVYFSGMMSIDDDEPFDYWG